LWRQTGAQDSGAGRANAALQNGYRHRHDCMPHDEYVAGQRRWLTEMMRLIRDTGAVFYNHKWRLNKKRKREACTYDTGSLSALPTARMSM